MELLEDIRTSLVVFRDFLRIFNAENTTERPGSPVLRTTRPGYPKASPYLDMFGRPESSRNHPLVVVY